MKTFIRLALSGAVLLPLALGLALIEREPLVATPLRATPEGAKAVKRLFHRVRAVTVEPVAEPTVEASVADLEHVMAFGARVYPGLRGAAERVAQGIRLRLSAPVPFAPGLGWINAEAVIPAFDQGPRLAAARLGRLDLPPELALGAARLGANLILGERFGDRLLAAVPRLELTPEGGRATLAMSDADRKRLFRRLAGTLRGGDLPSPQAVAAHLRALQEAEAQGVLAGRGSLTPYLRFIVEQAMRRARPGEERQELAAAIFALNAACGSQPFSVLIAKMSGKDAPPPPRTAVCRKVTLAGQDDKKRHFVTSAAIEVASTMRISLTMGEYKELMDSIDRWGFEFADIAANVSGLRFVEAFMNADPARWPELLARVKDEDSVLIRFDDLPGKLSRDEFVARFVNADSPAYREVMRRIEARAAALPVARPLPAPEG
ncbi:hypothetical protein [Oceanicella actignis]|uniref:hypothetical protein n=1 Tax=Oceanicella actignis TaxID=1189325 RepID=UPI0011E89870|nr:hypothetical protein [Oceanicella actignis]TYO88776.1 hypothetical protein LY05_01929 [Oceanicella actignis]